MSNRDDKINSVTNSINLLKGIIESPIDHKENIELLSSLNSQGSFAVYSNETEGIISVSLNTHKKYAEILLPNGFSEFNHLRVSALKKLTELESKTDKATPYSKKYYIDLSNEQKDYIEIMKKENFMLTIMVDELRSKLKEYMYNPTEDPERDFSDINKVIMKKLSHVNGVHDVN